MPHADDLLRQRGSRRLWRRLRAPHPQHPDHGGGHRYRGNRSHRSDPAPSPSRFDTWSVIRSVIRSVFRQPAERPGGLAVPLRMAQPGLQILVHPVDVTAGHTQSLHLGLECVPDL